MKRIFVLTLGFFLLVGAGSASDEGRVQSRDTLRAFNLFYLFSPDNPNHLKRVGQLRELAGETARPFRLVTVSHTAYEAPETPRPDRGPITSVPAAITRRIDGEIDYVVLAENDGKIRAEGSGESLESVLALLESHTPVATEIDENTWGKIKDLFQ